MHRITKAFTIFLALALAAAGLVACGGGGGGGGEDATQVMNDAFAHRISSGVVKADVNVVAKGSQSGTLKGSLSGPFQSKGTQSDINLKAAFSFSGAGQDFNFDGGLISSGGKVFVNYKGTDYALGGSQLQKAKQAKPGNLSALKTSLTNLKNDGNENVAGVDTVHISGTIDPGKLSQTFQQAISAAGSKLPAGAAAPTQKQLDDLTKSVKDASFNLFVGANDKIIRRFDSTLKVDGSAAGGSGSADITFAVEFSDVGKPQTVVAPKNAKPIAGLLSQIGLGGLGGLGGAGGAGASPGGSPSSGANSAYLDCLKKAKDQAAIAACASKIK